MVPDESHNSDGRHIQYLSDSAKWRRLDPKLFDVLKALAPKSRSVTAIEAAGILDATFSSEKMHSAKIPASARDRYRTDWFKRVFSDLSHCDLVFADPDNGLVDDAEGRRRSNNFQKRIPLNEATQLARGRSAIIYHHNSRFRGGHDAEAQHWMSQLGCDSLAIRASAYSCRTFFVVNPDPVLRQKVNEFCEIWSDYKVRLQTQSRQ
ncbi:hypothetical protein [Mesorhizobium sp. Mes31]|uniref:hypothetical protein n=1 Tax=Mesorhizobium sp. Mes31 TaxID=2926017 RepID=UPI002117D1CF|nr:hypothetical protein [Mesorhizobium sp. Mes31]